MALNSQSAQDYATTMYKIASGQHTFEDYPTFSWLASCAAHTMKRFVNSLEKLGKKQDKNLKRYVCFCFSLMLNCTDLDQLSEYFRLISVVHLSETRSESMAASERALVEAVNDRPETLAAIKKLVNRVTSSDEDHGVTIFDINDNGDSDAQIESTIETIDEDQDVGSKQSIKLSSPFTRHFEQIKQEVLQQVNAVSPASEENPHYNSEYIDHLLNKFMPYCFIWCGFVFKGTSLTRLTNGSVENFNRFFKSTKKTKVLPHRHMAFEFGIINGLCQEYLTGLNDPGTKTQSQHKLNVLDENDEENFDDAVEHYGKKPRCKALGYQSNINIGNLIKTCNEP